MSAPPVGGPKVTPVPSGLPVVALVGRPNVGKSALFNRLVGARRAIVDDAPGVTRDRLEAVATCGERRFLCVDTGGFLAEVPVRPENHGRPRARPGTRRDRRGRL